MAKTKSMKTIRFGTTVLKPEYVSELGKSFISTLIYITRQHFTQSFRRRSSNFPIDEMTEQPGHRES